jgi:hypothetical protein
VENARVTEPGAGRSGGGGRPPLPPSKGGRVVRLAVLVVVWVTWVGVATVCLELSGLAGDVGAWRWAALAFAPLVLPTWLLCRRLQQRRMILAVAMAMITVLAWGVPAQATPSFARVTIFADEWGGPPGGQLLGHAWEGNEWCFSDGCPTVVRYYAVPDAASSVEVVSSRLRGDGWRSARLAQGSAFCKGDYRVGIGKVRPDWLPHIATDLRPAPPGWEVVELRIGGNCL